MMKTIFNSLPQYTALLNIITTEMILFNYWNIMQIYNQIRVVGQATNNNSKKQIICKRQRDWSDQQQRGTLLRRIGDYPRIQLIKKPMHINPHVYWIIKQKT